MWRGPFADSVSRKACVSGTLFKERIVECALKVSQMSYIGQEWEDL